MERPSGIPDPKPTPDEIAIAMVEQLKQLNNHLAEMREVRIEREQFDGLGNLLDELNDWFATIDKTMEILKGNAGKATKLTLGDFVNAWEMAAEEVFGEDEEDDGDVLAGAEHD